MKVKIDIFFKDAREQLLNQLKEKMLEPNLSITRKK